MQIKKIIEMHSDNKDEDLRKDNFAHKLLFMIDNAFKEDFFNCTIDKGHCTAISLHVPATHWNEMSEAASIRLTQQKMIQKFLNLRFGHKIVVSEK